MRTLRILAGLGLCAGFVLLTGEAAAGRFGGGGRGGGGGFHGGGGGFHGGGYGGARPGGFGGGMPMSHPTYHAPAARPAAPAARSVSPGPVQRGTVHGPYGGTFQGARQTGTVAGARGAGTAARQAGTYTGPRGGQAVGGSRGGSYTTQGGYTINTGAGRGVYTGPRGTVAIGGGHGATITGPGGKTVGGGSGHGVVIGPNGNVHAGGSHVAGAKGPGGKAVATGSRAGITTGPGGTVATGSRGGIATGPGGTVAGGSRGGIATGPGGTVAGGSRGAVAVGPNGAVAAGSRGAVARGPGGTYAGGTRYVAASNLAGQGAYVRNSFRYHNAFTPGWYRRYPGAWFTAGWLAGSAWTAATWGGCASYVGYPAETTAYIYNYGDNVTYQDGSVYSGDQVIATEEQYADQATQIADAGRQADPAPDEKWQPLGVFAMVKGEETTSDNIFQLAMNNDGVLRGNYYNALTDATTPVYGSLDKKTQRVAWSVGDKKDVVYEAGLYNLTQEQTTMVVHFGKDRTEQYKLFRVEPPAEGQAEQPK
jgi:hypothetical protein